MNLRNALLVSLTLALAGCPTPPPSTGGDQPGQPGDQPGEPGQPGEPPPGEPGQPGEPPPGEPGEPGQPGEPPPEDAGDGPKDFAPNPEDLPSFADLIGEGESVTITITIEGTTSGQIDFHTLLEKDGHTQPGVLHIERFSNSSTVSVEAPANYGESVYVAVHGFKSDGHLNPEVGEVAVGGAEEPLTIGSTDIELTIAIGSSPTWLDNTRPEGKEAPPEGEGVELPPPPTEDP